MLGNDRSCTWLVIHSDSCWMVDAQCHLITDDNQPLSGLIYSWDRQKKSVFVIFVSSCWPMVHICVHVVDCGHLRLAVASSANKPSNPGLFMIVFASNLSAGNGPMMLGSPPTRMWQEPMQPRLQHLISNVQTPTVMARRPVELPWASPNNHLL